MYPLWMENFGSWFTGPPTPLNPLCNCPLSPVIVDYNDSLVEYWKLASVRLLQHGCQSMWWERRESGCMAGLPGQPVGVAGLGPAGASPCLEAWGWDSTNRQHSRHESLLTVIFNKIWNVLRTSLASIIANYLVNLLSTEHLDHHPLFWLYGNDYLLS